MARSELEKLIAVTRGNGAVGSGLSSLTRLLVDVLHRNQTPKPALTGGAAPPRLTQGKTIHPEGTSSARLLKAAPVMPAAAGVVINQLLARCDRGILGVARARHQAAPSRCRLRTVVQTASRMRP